MRQFLSYSFKRSSEINPLLLAERVQSCFDPFKPEFTIVIFIHYKPRIAVAILDL